MADKTQFKMNLSEQMMDALDAAAAATGRRTSQEVAEEVLNIYLWVWKSTEIAMKHALYLQTTAAATRPEYFK